MKSYKEIKEDGWIYVTAPFPEELAIEARIQAASENISRSELMRKAVEEYLRRRHPNHGFHLTAAPVGLWDAEPESGAAAGEPKR